MAGELGGDDRDKELQLAVFDWIQEDLTEANLHKTVTPESVAENYGIPQRHLVKYLEGELKEAEACRSLPLTLLLVISFAVMSLGHDDSISTRAVEDSLSHDLVGNANFALDQDIGHKDIYNVDSYADFWSWINHGFLPLLLPETDEVNETVNETHIRNGSDIPPMEGRGYWLHYNRIVGGVRLVQERSPGENGGDGAVTCSTYANLRPLYGVDCVEGLVYDLEPELGLPNDRALTTVNPTREQWLYVAQYSSAHTELMHVLEKERWLDRQTVKIEIAIPTYNAEIGLHTLTRVGFYFSRGGHIWKLIAPRSIWADWYNRWYFGLYDAIWIMCLSYMFLVEVFEIQGVVRQEGVGAIYTRYLTFWNLIDWLSVIFGMVIIGVFVGGIGMRTDLNGMMVKLGATDPTKDWDHYVSMTKQYLLLLEDNVDYIHTLRLLVAAYPLLIILRLFKSFTAQPKLALVTRTLVRAGPDLFHFMIVFVSVFVTFMICGIVLFGREVRSFTNSSRAFMSCLRIILGDVDWEELSKIGRTEASIWLWLFIIIMVLLMLNMILAIIIENYSDVKQELGVAETILEEGYQMWARWWGFRNGTYVPLQLVLSAIQGESRRALLHSLMSSHRVSRFITRLSVKSATTEASAASASISETSLMSDAKQQEDKTGDYIVNVDCMMHAVKRDCGLTMTRDQAITVIVAAVMDFYERNRTGAELDEVLLLSQKVGIRIKHLIKLTRRGYEERDTRPVEDLHWFSEELDQHIAAVREEREANRLELERLHAEKFDLQERLLQLRPQEVFPAANASQGALAEEASEGQRGKGGGSVEDVINLHMAEI